MKVDLPGPQVPNCCFCLDLKKGVFIIGVFCILSALYGIAKIFFFSFDFGALTTMVPGLCSIPPAAAFLMLMGKNTNDNRWLFASLFLLGELAGVAAYLAFSFLNLSIITPIIIAVVSLLITYYCYLVIKTYATMVDGQQDSLLS